MLTNCPMCKIILEVSTLNDHLLSDCDQKHLMKQCSNCKRPILLEQWLQHALKKSCTAPEADDANCPLCQTPISPPTDAGWRDHLLAGDGCPKNAESRRPKQSGYNQDSVHRATGNGDKAATNVQGSTGPESSKTTKPSSRHTISNKRK
ncbi:uncharacterized protein BYT42DRAFT_561014 [Radiomyces spectabilis]|uniref:uncharacterized protein n=1 Tax=Radiomyces spectabilis TaxID=64574 RepID=UPI00221E54BF|nr:uncharacterized protein BYT42DRAFT_561014 [Radiomyces spectabilis]KAI8388726.1 hypothetical protein BYT42DRAFT_561014 [Radiomyces spectabilis]